MSNIRVGVSQAALNAPLRQALELAAQAGAAGMQLELNEELNPKQLGTTARREIMVLLRQTNLQATALHCPLRRGLDNPEELQPRLEFLHGVIKLAAEIDCRNVILPLPELPRTNDDLLNPRTLTLRESLLSLSAAADRYGCFVACEVGFEPPEAILNYFAGFDTPSLQVNFDPVNFMAHGHKPLAALGALGPRIRHVQARDAQGNQVSGSPNETTLGAGSIDWLTFFAILETIPYQGFVVADRELGANRRADALAGVQFLKRFLPPLTESR